MYMYTTACSLSTFPSLVRGAADLLVHNTVMYQIYRAPACKDLEFDAGDAGTTTNNECVSSLRCNL